MKLLLGSVEEMFEGLASERFGTQPQSNRVVYWETVRQTRYPSGIPITTYTIRLTAVVSLASTATLVEVTLLCGSHQGEPHETLDETRKQAVLQRKRALQEKILQLAAHAQIDLRAGVLTADPQETLHGEVSSTQRRESS